MDPRELTKAEERIKALQKENDLLKKVTISQSKNKSAKNVRQSVCECGS